MDRKLPFFSTPRFTQHREHNQVLVRQLGKDVRHVIVKMDKIAKKDVKFLLHKEEEPEDEIFDI